MPAGRGRGDGPVPGGCSGRCGGTPAAVWVGLDELERGERRGQRVRAALPRWQSVARCLRVRHGVRPTSTHEPGLSLVAISGALWSNYLAQFGRIMWRSRPVASLLSQLTGPARQPSERCPNLDYAVRRGNMWRRFAELDGAVLAAPKDICAGHSVGPVGAVGEVITFDLDYAR